MPLPSRLLQSKATALHHSSRRRAPVCRAPQLWPKFLAYLGAEAGSQEEAAARRELEEQLQASPALLP